MAEADLMWLETSVPQIPRDMRQNRQLQLTPLQRACLPCGVNVHCRIDGDPAAAVRMRRAVSDRLTGGLCALNQPLVSRT
jgi:hypothetical protein